MCRYPNKRSGLHSIRPCSVHDVDAGLEYAKLLQAYSETAKDDLLIIMRVYFEKYVSYNQQMNQTTFVLLTIS